MKLTRVLERLYCDVWVIIPEMHSRITEVVLQHVSGKAHAAGIMDAFGAGKPDPMVRIVDRVAVVAVDGVISRKVSGIEKSSGMVDVGEVESALRGLAGDMKVDSIVLAIDSPGGTLPGVPELATAINHVKAVKPVVAYVDGMAASAAYWIASQCDEVVSTESGSVASIGVYLPIMDSSRAAEMQGLKMDVIKSGNFKGMGIPGTSLTEDQRELLQNSINARHEQFKLAVREGRGLPIADSVMQGQSFTAGEGKTLGLVDEIGGIEVAIAEAKTLARMKKK